MGRLWGVQIMLQQVHRGEYQYFGLKENERRESQSDSVDRLCGVQISYNGLYGGGTTALCLYSDGEFAMRTACTCREMRSNLCVNVSTGMYRWK